jgi:hypothetical protein
MAPSGKINEELLKKTGSTESPGEQSNTGAPGKPRDKKESTQSQNYRKKMLWKVKRTSNHAVANLNLKEKGVALPIETHPTKEARPEERVLRGKAAFKAVKQPSSLAAVVVLVAY